MSEVMVHYVPRGRVFTWSFHEQLHQFRSAYKQEAVVKELVIQGQAACSLAVCNERVIGYALVVPPDEEERWALLPYVTVMGALEVALPYRRNGVAGRILQRLFAGETTVEDQIVIALEYCWHWDVTASGLNVYEYKHMLKALLERASMEQIYTDDPDISAHAANFMMARIGKRVSSDQMQQFFYTANPRAF